MSDVSEDLEDHESDELEDPEEAALGEVTFGLLVVARDAERMGGFFGLPEPPFENVWNGGTTARVTRFTGRGMVIFPHGEHIGQDLVRSGIIVEGKTILSAEPGDESDIVEVPFDASNPWKGNPEAFTYRPPKSGDPEEPEHPHLYKVDFTVRYSGTLVWENEERKVTTLVRYLWEAEPQS